MTKINNTQRAAFARILRDKKATIEKKGANITCVTKWNWESQEHPVAQKLIAKHKVRALRETEKKAEIALDNALDALMDDLKELNDQARQTWADSLEAINFAVRDIWAAEDVESAKEIVAKFVKN